MQKDMKLQTFLAHAGVASRRKSEEYIVAGRVRVNGEVAHLGQRISPDKDTISFDDQPITNAAEPTTYLIYKPVGIVSTTTDELGRQTVVDFLKNRVGSKTILPRLYPVGRLDRDSEGLMILTNDGELTQKMTHPSFEMPKTYEVTVNGEPTEKALAHLRRGVRLQEGMTSPAEVEVIESEPDQTTLQITIHEGRYHQVKRMLLRVGYEVTKLKRVAMGPYTLADLGDQPFARVQPGQ